MTDTPITQAERFTLRDRLEWDTEPFLLTRAQLTGLLAALEAAEAERSILRIALIACGKAVGASVSEGCTTEFLCMIPQEVALVREKDRRALEAAEAEREAFNAMASLMALDVGFVNHVKGGGIGFNVLCSDTFAYACADCEAIDISQAPEVWKLYQDGGYSAVALWVQEKRGGEKFIKPVEEMVNRSKAILAERDALKKDATLAEFERNAACEERDAAKAKLAEALSELHDWRDSAKTAAAESCGDERHCTCVGPLRQALEDAKAKLAALVEALTSYDKGGVTWIEVLAAIEAAKVTT